MTFSPPNSKQARRSRNWRKIQTGSGTSPPVSWLPLLTSSTALHLPSEIDWPVAPLPNKRTTTWQLRDANLDWQEWLRRCAPAIVHAGFAPHHAAFWEWVWSVQPKERPRPFIAIWPRGGGKSSSTELMSAALLLRGKRRYALYVSGTQEQADKHVEAIGALLERLDIERRVGKYGASRGWRRNRLRAAAGFTVDAFGLDTGSRGTKDDDARPDLIVFDDLDAIHDSPATTRKKVETLTMTVLPAATDNAAIVGVQNLIHAHGIFAQLADDRADWLSDRIVSGPHPALLDYEVQLDDADPGPDGMPRYIVRGMPTWQGMDRDACQRIVNTIGPEAFARECQHAVGAGRFAIYPVIRTCSRFAIPAHWPRMLGSDFGGVHTCGVFVAAELEALKEDADPAKPADWRQTGRYYVYREYMAGGKTAAEHAAAIRQAEPPRLRGCGGSKSEDQWRREFARAGLKIVAPPFADVQIGIDRVAGALGRHELIIFDDLAGLLQDLRTYRRAPDAQGQPTAEIVNKESFHYADALRYAWARISTAGIGGYQGVR